MDLTKIKEDANPRFKSLLWFGITFVSIFTLLWLFIEPVGFDSIFGAEYHKEHKVFIYVLFLIVSMIISVIFELARRTIMYQRHTNALIEYISTQNHSSTAISENVSKKDISELLKQFSADGIQLNDSETNRYKIVFLDNLLVFFQWLGLTNTIGTESVPSSELAMLYIRSIGAHLSENSNPLEGITRPEAHSLNKELRVLLEKIEKRRVDSNVLASPIREVMASIILLKAKNDKGEDVFLMQHSKSWNGGYYWWIGGIREEKDTDNEQCARRELNEELNIEAKNISSLEYLGECSEQMISSRLGAYSKYNYNLYLLNIKNHKTIPQLFLPENEINVPREADMVKRKIKWFTWEELRTNPDLIRDSKSIIDLIEKVELHNSRISTNKIIE